MGEKGQSSSLPPPPPASTPIPLLNSFFTPPAAFALQG